MSNRTVSCLLWVVSLLLAMVLGAFQRMTGPTYPLRGETTIGQQVVTYKLLRTHGGKGGLPISVEVGETDTRGSVLWRRFPTREPWESLAMIPDHGRLETEIPHQPPAGKVEYRVILERNGQRSVVPLSETVIARFRGNVPARVLIPHIVAMFASMLLATRALLEVLRRAPVKARGYVLVTLVFLALGGLALGPVVQKHAFGAYWTGWPLGTDLTDNKTLIAVLGWLPASICALRARRVRLAVIAGWIVMTVVFLIPHSLRGSEIDWAAEAEVTEGPSERGREGLGWGTGT